MFAPSPNLTPNNLTPPLSSLPPAISQFLRPLLPTFLPFPSYSHLLPLLLLLPLSLSLRLATFYVLATVAPDKSTYFVKAVLQGGEYAAPLLVTSGEKEGGKKR